MADAEETGHEEVRMNSVAKFARKVELFFWMARFPTESAVFAAAGWLVSRSSVDWRLVAVAFGVIAGRATVNLLNDVFDADKDKTTAPDLPIPSGRVTLKEATRAAEALMVGSVAAIVLAAPTAGTKEAAVGVIVSALAMVALYSRLKGTGLPASLLAAALYWMPGALGWLAGGARHPGEFAVLFLGLVIVGTRGNIYAGIRDIDSDPLVGNATTAVRLGLNGSVVWSVALSSVAGLTGLWLSIARHNVLGVVWTAAATALPLVLLPRHRAAFAGDSDRTRRSRTQALASMRVATLPVMVGFGIAASPLVGVIVAALFAPLGQLLFRLYMRRMPAVLGPPPAPAAAPAPAS